MGNEFGKKRDFSQAEHRRSFYLTVSDIPSDIEEFEQGLLGKGFVVNQLFGGRSKVRRHLRLSTDKGRLFLAKEQKKGEKNVKNLHMRSADEKDFFRGLLSTTAQMNLEDSSTTIRESFLCDERAKEPPGIVITHITSEKSIIIQTTTQENHRNLLRFLKQTTRFKSRTAGDGQFVSNSGGLRLLLELDGISSSSSRRKKTAA
mmetsp:Transcript_11715/g.19449  ORF Transcript_11715/g.19449 Transcript_11715/m.19449 type:complete len:203 (-) Transcript_11715:288-896(-)